MLALFHTTSTLVSALFFANLIHAASVPANGALPKIRQPTEPAVRSPTDFDTIFADILERAASSNSSTEAKTISKAADVAAPPAPNLFEFVFGPINAANNANGFMGFVFLDSFDVNECATLCNARGFNNQSGPCIFFNIWTPVVNGTATSPTCSMYNTVTDSTTATNTGQGDLQVTSSIGYSRINLIQDGSFQIFTCTDNDNGVPDTGCTLQNQSPWLVGPELDSNSIDIDISPAHSGNTSAAFFLTQVAVGTFGAKLTYGGPFPTIPEQQYLVSLFYTLSSDTEVSLKSPLFLVIQNDGLVLMQPFQTQQFEDNTFFNAVGMMRAEGSDTLFLQNGNGSPHLFFVDDIAVFEAFQ